MKSRLTILKNSTIYKKKSTPHVYWFLRLFPSSTPPLLELCTSIFQKIPPSMFIPTSTFIREMRVLVWTIQPTGLNTCMHLYCCNFEQTWTRTHFFFKFILFRIFLLLYTLLVLCNKSTECNDHGTCGDDGKCLCHDGYFGTDCSSELMFFKD